MVQQQEQIMATTAKRPGKKTTARRKPAKKAGTKKASANKTAKKVAATARRGATGKTAQRKAAPKRRPQAAKAAKAKSGTRASTRSAGNTSAAKKSKLGARTKTARSRSKPVPAKKTHRRMSPQARKNLVAKHLREMLEEKNRRAAQTPAWQQIVHHDHPAPVSPPRVAEAEEAAPSVESGPVATDDGNRDRGGN
jgi:hypothetical protein